MKAGLVSINKPHTDNIFNLIKTIEWRKSPLPTGLNYVYETKNKGGCGKVIGEIWIEDNDRLDIEKELKKWHIKRGCVPLEDLKKYATKDFIYANYIGEVKRYDKPKELREFKTECKEWDKENPNCDNCKYFIDCRCYEYDESDCACDGIKPVERPPQSWCYVEELGV